MDDLLICTHAPTVLVQDTLENSGRQLLQTLMTDVADRVDRVQLVLYETTTEDFIHTLPVNLINKIHVTDVGKDPLEWDGSRGDTPGVSMATDTCRHLVDVWRPLAVGSRVAVVVDCASHAIMTRSVAYTCRTIQRLKRNLHCPNVSVEQVLVLVHADLHDNVTLAQLRHTVATEISIASSTHRSVVCEVLHKKLSGKIAKQSYEISMNECHQMSAVKKVQSSTVPASRLQSEKEVDPTENLTFNLRLSDKEKQARSQLVLPYMQTTAQSEVSSGDGRVYYEPDEDDDYDEEDPDDDLDI